MGIDYSVIERELFSPRFGSASVGEIRAIVFAAYMSQYPSGSEPSNYRIGRDLGLTENQVKNLRVKANLLLEDEEATKDRARRSFSCAIQTGSLEYQAQKGRIAVQLDDAVAFNYLSATFSTGSVFRDADFSNGHIAVPVHQFGQLLSDFFPEIDLEEVDKLFRELSPEYALAIPDKKTLLFDGLQKWLPVASSAVSIMEALAKCILTSIGI